MLSSHSQITNHYRFNEERTIHFGGFKLMKLTNYSS